MRKTIIPGALCVLLAGLCAAGLLASRSLLRNGGTTDIRAAGSDAGFSGTLYVPDGATVSNTAPSVLLLQSGRGAPARTALALELSRRGLVVLEVRDPAEAEAAWAWLTAQPFVWVERTGLVALDGAVPAALALAEETPVPQAAVLLGGGDALTRALAAPAALRDALIVTGAGEPERADLAAFLGCGAEEAAPDKTCGFFYEGNARRLVLTSGGGQAVPRSREALAAVFDWLGSSLGHRVELADDDLVCGKREALFAAGAVCGVLSAGCLALTIRRLRGKRQEEKHAE